jgi:hypothetical protein
MARVWIKLHNEELHMLYASPNNVRAIKSMRMRWAAHVTCMGEMRDVYKILVRKPEVKRSLEIPRRRWDDNIGMDLKKVVCGLDLHDSG